MKTTAFAAPILKGKEKAARQMIAQLRGDYRSDAEALRRTAGIDREQAYFMSTPMGEVAIVVWDVDDVARANECFATDDSKHAIWFRKQLEDIHGFDMSDPTGTPESELVAEWTDSAWSFGDGETNAVCYPLKPGAADKARAFGRELVGSRKDDFARTRRELGITRQLFFVMPTPNGDFAIMYGEGKPGWLERGFKATATSNDPFLTWFREQVSSFAAVPMFQNATPPTVEHVLEITVRVPAGV